MFATQTIVATTSAAAKADGPFQVGAENLRRHEAHEYASHRAAGGNHHVIFGQMICRGRNAHQLAVTHHANEKHRAEMNHQIVQIVGVNSRHIPETCPNRRLTS